MKNAIFVTRQVKTGNFGLLGAIKIRGMDFYATKSPFMDHQELLGCHIYGFKLGIHTVVMKSAIFVTRQVKTSIFGLLGAPNVRGNGFFSTVSPLFDHY